MKFSSSDQAANHQHNFSTIVSELCVYNTDQSYELMISYIMLFTISFIPSHHAKTNLEPWIHWNLSFWITYMSVIISIFKHRA